MDDGKFPTEVFVRWKGAAEPYLEVSQRAGGLLDLPEEEATIGVYRLVEVVNVTSVIKVEATKKHERAKRNR
jgi:hypothetical protein